MFASENVEVEVLRNVDTEVELKLAATRSAFPSLLMSPIATEYGVVPVVKSAFAARENVEVEVLRRTEADAALLFAVTISIFPSLLRSPTATEIGADPVVKSAFAAREKVDVDVLRNTETELEL